MNTCKKINKLNYRIDNLELRLTGSVVSKSPYLEIVQWMKNESSCYTIASFVYDNDGLPELHFIGSRPLELNKRELEIFWQLVKNGYTYEIRDGEITIEEYSEGDSF
jgi:hypothetical protein